MTESGFEEQEFDWACCKHCGCEFPHQIGHDDTCIFGCNDEEPLSVLIEKFNNN